MFLAVFIITFILGMVWPCFYTISVLLVFLPITGVFGSVYMFVCTATMSFVTYPISIEAIAIGVDQSAKAMRLVILPISFVFTAVFPALNTFAFSHTFRCPLTCVHSFVIEFIRSSRY
jgi:hypothetical protein